MQIEWLKKARTDFTKLTAYIAKDNPDAASNLRDEITTKVEALPDHPKLYKVGRIKGTREMVVRPNYVVVYKESAKSIKIVRVLHAAQQWPPTSGS